MANQDDGFLREVEEELRRERLEKIWRQYGNYIIAAAVLIVVGVAGFKYYESSRLSAAQATGARYQEAIALAEDGKEGSAAKEFETIASEGGKGYRALARLQLAGTLLKEGKRDEAFKTFEVLADDSSADDMLRQYAALQAASLRLGKADFTEMQNRLNPLIGDESPWRYSAREMLGLAAFKAGKNDEARNLLTPLLVDQKAPKTVSDRVQIMLAEIAGGEMDKKKNDSAAAPTPPTEAKAQSAPANGAGTTETKKE